MTALKQLLTITLTVTACLQLEVSKTQLANICKQLDFEDPKWENFMKIIGVNPDKIYYAKNGATFSTEDYKEDTGAILKITTLVFQHQADKLEKEIEILKSNKGSFDLVSFFDDEEDEQGCYYNNNMVILVLAYMQNNLMSHFKGETDKEYEEDWNDEEWEEDEYDYDEEEWEPEDLEKPNPDEVSVAWRIYAVDYIGKVLSILHENNIIIGRFRLDSIFYDGAYELSIGNFGYSQIVDGGDEAKSSLTVKNTTPAAKEKYIEEVYTQKEDRRDFALIVYQLMFVDDYEIYEKTLRKDLAKHIFNQCNNLEKFKNKLNREILCDVYHPFIAKLFQRSSETSLELADFKTELNATTQNAIAKIKALNEKYTQEDKAAENKHNDDEDEEEEYVTSNHIKKRLYQTDVVEFLKSYFGSYTEELEISEDMEYLAYLVKQVSPFIESLTSTEKSKVEAETKLNFDQIAASVSQERLIV